MIESGIRRTPELRLFFALWPSDARRAALAVAAAPAILQVDGHPVAPAHLHVTLAFLGMVPGRSLAQLIEAGGQGPRPAIELEFDRLEFWAKPKVLVAVPVAVPQAARDMVDRLWTSVAPLGFKRESRPWHPHLTLVRRVRRPPPENLPLAPVEKAGDESPWRLALVESTTHADGARYKPLADWGLQA